MAFDHPALHRIEAIAEQTKALLEKMPRLKRRSATALANAAAVALWQRAVLKRANADRVEQLGKKISLDANTAVYECSGLSEHLLRLLMELDAVTFDDVTDGDARARIRAARKMEVTKINQALQQTDALVSFARRVKARVAAIEVELRRMASTSATPASAIEETDVEIPSDRATLSSEAVGELPEASDTEMTSADGASGTLGCEDDETEGSEDEGLASAAAAEVNRPAPVRVVPAPPVPVFRRSCRQQLFEAPEASPIVPSDVPVKHQKVHHPFYNRRQRREFQRQQAAEREQADRQRSKCQGWGNPLVRHMTPGRHYDPFPLWSGFAW
jgi:hypothetical protein